MNNHNFTLVGVDTDSCMFSKLDMTKFSDEEQINLINEINSYMPDKIKFAHDGIFKTIISLKAKNYVMQSEDGKVKIKGSALKDQKKPKALLEFLRAIIDAILEDKTNYEEIYLKYVREILNLTDIKRWSSKRTVTENVIKGTRTNETKVMSAIKDTEYVESDRIWVYYNTQDQLKLVEHFNNDYSIVRLLKQLHSTSKVFKNIMDVKRFKNYSLKNKKIQEELKELIDGKK